MAQATATNEQMAAEIAALKAENARLAAEVASKTAAITPVVTLEHRQKDGTPYLKVSLKGTWPVQSVIGADMATLARRLADMHKAVVAAANDSTLIKAPTPPKAPSVVPTKTAQRATAAINSDINAALAQLPD